MFTVPLSSLRQHGLSLILPQEIHSRLRLQFQQVLCHLSSNYYLHPQCTVILGNKLCGHQQTQPVSMTNSQLYSYTIICQQVILLYVGDSSDLRDDIINNGIINTLVPLSTEVRGYRLCIQHMYIIIIFCMDEYYLYVYYDVCRILL